MQNQSGDTPEAPTPSQAEGQAPPPTPTVAQPSLAGADERPTFPIVGIGASAGGLEAFEKFFAHMPRNSGIAFILAQHLSPGRQALLGEVMERFTAMQVQVVPANHGTVVQPNRVYILPPDQDAALRNGILSMSQPEPVAGVRLPIDIFFRSLAEDLKERAICIILSGAGSDGSKGLQFIKEQGGMVMVQSPASAMHHGMPQSAIDTDLVDYILRPEQMPEQLQAYIRKEFLTGERPVEARISTAANALQRIFALLRRQTGHDFSLYKPNTIIRRIDRRMTIHQLERVEDYVRHLESHPLEIDILFRELLIGVTSFFRDPLAFQTLAQQVIPQLFSNRPRDTPIRIWVPACSTGEEAYSIAMLLVEQMDTRNEEYEIQIFATDIDEQAIERARLGNYPENIAIDISAERLRRFFIHEEKTFQVTKRLRNLVVFAVQSVTRDPPFSRIDLVSCRNLLIYLSPELQNKLFPLFHYALKPGGFLFLGGSETSGNSAHLFTTIDRKASLYQRQADSPMLQQLIDFPPQILIPNARGTTGEPLDRASSLRQIAERAIIQRYVPSCAVVSQQGDLYYTLGRTGLYLEPPEGEMSSNILHMAREGLRLPLTTALRRIAANQQEMVFKDVQVKTNGGFQLINLIVQPLDEHGLALVIFEESAPRTPATETVTVVESSNAQDSRIRQLEQELQATREYLQVTTEELETTNEELQSSNEELQSTNEELETSKEELQSMHEEQMAINTELRSKIEQLNQANNDLRNLLASIDVGTIFLDLDLQITRFTPVAGRVISLRDTDIGRPVSELVAKITDGLDLAAQAQRVLDTLVSSSQEVQNREGEWYWMRILPYRTSENVIAGVIITFSNITQQKHDREQIPRLLRAAEKSAGMIMMTDVKGTIEYVNPHLLSVTGYSEDEIIGQPLRMLLADEEGSARSEPVWHRVLAGEEWQGEFRRRRKNGETYWVSASFSPVYNSEGGITNIVIAEEDISERKRASAARERLNRLLAALGVWHRQAARATDPHEPITALCRLLIDAGGYRAAWVGLVVPHMPTQVRPVAQAGFDTDYLERLPAPWRDATYEDSPLREVLLENRSMVLYTEGNIVAIQTQQQKLGVLVLETRAAELLVEAETETIHILVDNLIGDLQRLQDSAKDAE